MKQLKGLNPRGKSRPKRNKHLCPECLSFDIDSGRANWYYCRNCNTEFDLDECEINKKYRRYK